MNASPRKASPRPRKAAASKTAGASPGASPLAPLAPPAAAQAPAARQPQQPRGTARVEMILAAASQLIAESGTAAVSIHAVARRAKTSIGSMYHFFPHREGLLDALVQRHLASIRAINEDIAKLSPATWRSLTAQGAVDRLVTPFIAHLRAHPDFLALMHGRVDTQEDAEFIRGIRCMLAARLPQASSQETDDYAAVMHAMAAGGMHVGHERDAARQDVYLREIPRALAAYLALAEAGQ
ncbi:MAG: TetR/AcrR family transcriptional regulator [Comamonadaceae bacterium]|nr:MAG: TetR/AcrR family transcriptional regulator [Comamonadaceae bacterium]